jgi:4-hydroxy-2-oxoheptanedioate aldolase
VNKLEKRMVELLCELKDKYYCIGIKAEFEAEGTRIEEAMRLKDVSSKAGLGLNIKVGGCEAIKDMFEAATLGVERIIGPMVETAYALKKFLAAAKMAFGTTQNDSIELLINIETITSVHNFEAMLALPQAGELHGVVIGRVDMSGSMDLTREEINSQKILDIALKVASLAKKHHKQVVVGGGVSVHSRDFFKRFPPGHLDRFETRKVIFGCPEAIHNPEEAFLKAVEFELLWLRNKKAYYGAIHSEDDARLVMMEKRYKDSIEAINVKASHA